ncbi:hypothetical protein BKA62DRAFT_711740 [Auriculariales sp. MPI-PUGE-AT-0066]|nr:hypothetical protein BKA62DRAFT_711740 [Auriculariales sp. MPI-PUGE-AT-0066]
MFSTLISPAHQALLTDISLSISRDVTQRHSFVVRDRLKAEIAHIISLALNSVSATLPPELLCEVFQYLEFRQRLQASSTCKYWREVALASPSLWQHLELNESEVVPAFLARSEPAPIDMIITTTGSHSSVLRASLHEHLWRMRSLEVRMGVSYRPSTITDVLTTTSPMIESLILDKRFALPISSHALPNDLLGGQAPRLRRMLLAGFYPEISSASLLTLADLTTLVISGHTEVTHNHAFELLRALQALEVYVVTIDNLLGGWERYAGPKLHCPQLRCLGLRMRSPSFAQDGILDPLDDDTLSAVELRTVKLMAPISHADRCATLWASGSNTTSRHYNLHVSCAPISYAGQENAPQHSKIRTERRFEMESYDVLIQLATPVIAVAPLREITLAVWLLCGHIPLLSSPAAPASIPTLETLTILVSVRGAFFGKLSTDRLVESIPLWRFPGLKVLRLARDPQANAGLTRAVSIPPESIVEFLKEERARGMPKLERLALLDIWSAFSLSDVSDSVSEIVREDASQWAPEILVLDECDKWLCKY